MEWKDKIIKKRRQGKMNLLKIASVICLALKLKFGVLFISPDDQVTNP